MSCRSARSSSNILAAANEGGLDGASTAGFLVIEEIRNVTPESVRAADRNSDGKLSLEEYLNARFRDFAVIDANGDGTITQGELDAAGRGQGRTR